MNFSNNSLIICPNETKKDILKSFNNDNKLHNIKFMDINDFRSNYFFSYDYRAIAYLYNKYNYNLEISKVYLKSLYSVDISNSYIDSKLIFLRDLKKELIDNKLLSFNNYFKKYLENKKIYIINYPVLEKYLDDVFKELNATIVEDNKSNSLSVYKFDSMDQEVSFVAEKICDLIRSGVSINNIYITNYSDSYYFLIKKYFELYNININFKRSVNLNSFNFVNNYFITSKLPTINDENSCLVKAFINKINSISYLEGDNSYKVILKDIIKDTSISYAKYIDSVNICDIYSKSFSSSDYVFYLGFNYDNSPKTYKDDMFISDSIKTNLYTTSYKNKREEEVLIKRLKSIPNLFISYKLSDFKNKYYPSTLIDKYKIKENEYLFNNLSYSELINKRNYSILLDRLYKYDEFDNRINLLSCYPMVFNTYDSSFTGISEDVFNKYNKDISLSYTSMNSYNLCPFKYYVNYILKADSFKENFITLIGNLFHFILEHSYDKDFDFYLYFDKYLESKILSNKDNFFLAKLKRILHDEIEIIKDNDKYTLFNNRMFEKKIDIVIQNNLYNLVFTGKIDKILYYKEINDTYFTIVDYKTGTLDPSINNMKYGIGSQLATYLYLIIKGNLFDNPIFSGMYLQSVLMKDQKADLKKNYKDLLRNNLKYDGYSTDNQDVLYKFDENYLADSMIKGLRVKSDGNFYSTSKVLSDIDISNLYKYTEDLINKTFNNIMSRNFTIRPIKIDLKDKSCSKCTYKDVCFMKESFYKFYEKNDSLDFLGGEEDD